MQMILTLSGGRKVPQSWNRTVHWCCWWGRVIDGIFTEIWTVREEEEGGREGHHVWLKSFIGTFFYHKTKNALSCCLKERYVCFSKTVHSAFDPSDRSRLFCLKCKLQMFRCKQQSLVSPSLHSTFMERDRAADKMVPDMIIRKQILCNLP